MDSFAFWFLRTHFWIKKILENVIFSILIFELHKQIWVLPDINEQLFLPFWHIWIFFAYFKTEERTGFKFNSRLLLHNI